ncbi:MAG: PKD domain-containing protein [Cyclobacteriaceae bacterium]
MNKKGLLFLALCSFVFQLHGGPGTGFIENKNQWPCEVDFLADVPGGQMAISSGQFNYFFLDYQKVEGLHDRAHHKPNESNLASSGPEDINGRKISVRFLGSNANASFTRSDRSSTYYNYFLGQDETRWASKAYAYQQITYKELYEGIDLRLKYDRGQIKYDLIVSPGFDPSVILLDYQGSKSVTLSDGDLEIDGEFTKIIERKPISFQFIDGEKKWINTEYQFLNNQIVFAFPDGYDPCYELIIDPLLIFSTYSGSQADNWGSTATPGESGNLYSAGVTNHFVSNPPVFSGTFLATSGAFQTSYGGIFDVAILKYDSAGNNLLYASYLGGSQSESPHSLVMDKDENLLILGTTSSSDFPTTASAFDRNYDGGGGNITHVVNYANGADIFVAKVSKDGSQLLASTFLGGNNADGMMLTTNALVQNYGDELRGDIIADESGNIYISSVTASSNFPAVNSFDMTFSGETDAVVVKFDSNLSEVLWSAFLGGSFSDAAYSIKLDGNGKIYLAGGTTSADFPTTSMSYQQGFAGTVDGWIAKLEPDGSGLIASSYTGSSVYDQIYFIDLNSSDEVYAYGQTAGGMPISDPSLFHTDNGGQFLQKFSNDLTELRFSTLFGSGGGKPNISPTAFLVNECNNIYMTGWGGLLNSLPAYNGKSPSGSSTTGLPTTDDAYQKTTSGSDFYFMVLTDDASQFLYGTYLGGSQSRTHVDGGTSRFDKSGIVYHAVCSGCSALNGSSGPSSDFPTTPNAWSATNNSLNCNNAAFKFDLSSLNARIVTNTLALDHPGIADLCLPDKLVFQNRSTGGQFYEWDFGDGTNETKPDTAAIIHEYKQTGTYSVKLRAVDQGTCVGEDFDFATVRVHQATGFAGDDATICEGSSIQLEAGGGTNYEWRTKPDGVVSDLARPLLTPKDTTSYFVSIIDTNGCVVKDTVEVDVVPRIDLRFDYQKISDCYSRSALQVTNTSPEEFEQFFDLGDGNNSTQRELTYNYENDGVYNIRLVGKRDFCTFEEVVTLPFITIKVPNVLTPGNTDASSSGKNDTFRIRYGPAVDSPTTAEAGVKVALSVYNRWGKVVYHNSDYKDEWGAEGLEAGTYYYEVEIENEPLCKGWVQLIR